MPVYAFHLLIALLLLLQSPALPASSIVDVEVPIRFEARYLDNLLTDTVFAKQSSLSIWGDDSGCNDVTLSNPELEIESGQILIISDVKALSGFAIGERCLGFIDWQGKVRARQRVDILDPRGQIAFSTVETTLLDSEGNPSTVSNRIWSLTSEHIYPHLDRLRIDISAAIDEVAALLPLFLQDGSRDSASQVLDSFHLDHLEIDDNAVTAVASFSLAADTAEAVDGKTIAPPERAPWTEPGKRHASGALSDAELTEFVEVWDRLDAFLGFTIKVAARQGLSTGQKDILFDSLIELRYALVDALTDPGTTDNDTLREAFITAWNQFAPVFRSLSLDMHGAEALRFFGFIAAGDAIRALDQIGSLAGWSVSVDGLRRLARMLIQDPYLDPLEIDPIVDPELRQMFDLGPALELPPTRRSDDTDPESLLNWFDWIIRDANAAERMDLDATVAGPGNIDRYLSQVHGLLISVAQGTLMIKPLDAQYRALFRALVLATAWQETCWRQYRKGGDGIEPMRSPAGAVGLMQVMPRVWRGFYDADSLAGDIEYNAAAGSEILHRYLVRYALRKGEHNRRGGVDNLARATYAAYNGGPRHLTRYRKKSTSGSLRAIDLAFWDKFITVRDGDELAVRGCYHY